MLGKSGLFLFLSLFSVSLFFSLSHLFARKLFHYSLTFLGCVGGLLGLLAAACLVNLVEDGFSSMLFCRPTEARFRI